MIGLFIGSFNPFTKAHLDICHLVLKKLDKIILVPVNSNKKKLVSLETRLEMLKLITDNKIKVDDICLNYSNFNSQILDILKEKYFPFKIIMGTDLLVDFKHFDQYENLLKEYDFIIIERNGYNTLDIINNDYALYKDKFEIILYNSEISSTLVRNNLYKMKSINNYLDKRILNYIKENHLYEKN